MIQLLPIGGQIDPIADTWVRGLVATAIEKGIVGLCWHVGHGTATGYVTVTRLHEAEMIRAAWARELGLSSDDAGGYTGQSGGITIAVPDATDPDEHCRVCETLFDPRDGRPDGLARFDSGDVCRGCVTNGRGPAIQDGADRQ